MSEITHTLGPWSVHSDDGDDWLMVMAGGPSGKIVANVNPETFSAGVADLVEMPAEANARLIAAAPELLEALQLFARYEQEMEADDHVAGMLTYAQLREAARSAIAKATGGAK